LFFWKNFFIWKIFQLTDFPADLNRVLNKSGKSQPSGAAKTCPSQNEYFTQTKGLESSATGREISVS